MDQERIEKAVYELLSAIGEDPERSGLKETPNRVARMYAEIFSGIEEDPHQYLKIFDEDPDHNELVLVRDIPLYSVCEHHLLAFYVKAHVAYIPDEKVAGLSKLARTVEVFARRPQIQENMTAQIADAIEKYLQPKGVMVMLEAEHMCMTMRGAKKPGTITSTIVTRGVFETDYSLQQTFLQMVRS